MSLIPTPPGLLAGLAVLSVAGATVWSVHQRADNPGVDQQVLGIATASRILSLHPHEAAQPGTALMRTRMIQALREGLVEFNPRTQTPQSAVAEKWEIAPDSRSAVFHLRRDAEWNNGEPLVAGDFVFAWRLALTTHSGVSETLAILKNARAFSQGRVDDVGKVGVTALDEHTLRLDLEHPVPGLLVELCDMAWLPLHAGSIGALHDRSYWQWPDRLVTNGAFELAGATADVVTLRPNPHFHDRDMVHLRRIEIHFTEDAALFPRLLQSGRVQLSDRLASGEVDLPPLAGTQLWRDPTLAAGFVHFNLRGGPLTDRRVRWALSLALDRAAMARDISSANVRPAFDCLPPIADWDKTQTVVENLAEARRLLAEAGYPGGRGFPMLRWPYRVATVDASVRLPEVCADQWRTRLGLPVYVQPMSDEDFQNRIAKHDYDVVLAGVLGTLPDKVRLASQLAGSAMRDYSGWDGGAVPQLVEVARQEGGDALPDKVMAVEEAFLAEMPATPVIFYNRHTLKNVSVAGWFPDSTGLHPLKYLYLTTSANPAHDD